MVLPVTGNRICDPTPHFFQKINGYACDAGLPSASSNPGKSSGAGDLPRRILQTHWTTSTGDTTIPTYAILTSSDSGSDEFGGREDGWQDLGGNAVANMMSTTAFDLKDRAVVPDEKKEISSKLKMWTEAGIDLIVTTGGTGLAPRDVTPEATAAVVDTVIPGIAEAMRMRSLEVTPFAMISRGMAGATGKTLIINLPGNPKGVAETLEVVLPVLAHAVEVLQGRQSGHPLP